MIDRSKFKASNQQEVAQQDQAMANAAGKGRRGIAENLEISIGVNRFRIYPAHPEGGFSFAEAVSRVFLPAMVQERGDDGKPIQINGSPKLKKGMKPVFNSKLHGNTPKDLVEEYYKIGVAIGEGMKDPEKKKGYLAKLNGQYSDNAQYRLPGISYKLTYEMYADKLGAGAQVLEFGRLAVSKSVKDKMNQVAAYESSNDPLGMDPYSDPNTGLPVVITKQQQAPKGQPQIKPNDMYLATIDKNFDRASKTLIEYPLSDEQLEKFLTFPSLHKLFRGAFKKSDFELQLTGLEMFDADYSMGIFHTDEFLNIAEEISNYYVDEPAPAAEGVEGEPEGEDEIMDEPTTDQFDVMTRLELKGFISKEKLGITFKTTTKDEDIRTMIRTAMTARSAPIGSQEDLPGTKTPLPVTPAPESKPAVTAPTGGVSASDRLRNLKRGVPAT